MQENPRAFRRRFKLKVLHMAFWAASAWIRPEAAAEHRPVKQCNENKNDNNNNKVKNK